MKCYLVSYPDLRFSILKIFKDEHLKKKITS